ncbi:X-ray repair cross-complementing protein 5-like [Nilaparvata lugens]|uniref:X-ray repair cross-complementing protein 5-like n=1 Tax=Nilaparvata lugens TaxID=108931 RepID=UPI00193D21FF|nr:X-ray repair cross-complementing protein 5-like [Nilaparvata lugens]XP_039275761.1 X-ray repair cross-complementing protein 5-like [Nilaparvata lugens]XP_039275762.1 X-ray repair cross-complementing protein 5-like [Nilaparvata lugens]
MVASWDLVTAVSGLSINHRVTNSDWCDALVVAMQCLKEKMDDTKNMKKVNHITTAKLVMLSSFSQDVDDSCMDSVVSAIINTDMEVIFIAPDEVAERIEEDSTGKTLSHGENALRKVIEKTGTMVAVSEAVTKLSHFSRKKTSRMRWISEISIGSKISIPINGYKIMNEPLLKKEKRCLADGALVKADFSYVHGADEVPREDIINGYVYADVIVPLSKLDREAMTYRPGAKGLSILGFVKKSAVKQHHWTGKSAFYVIGALNDASAESAMAAFVRALSDMGMVAIARKVYSQDRGLKVGALYPKPSANPPALIFIELPYSNEIRALQFPSLKKTKVTEEQYAVIDKLIDSMDSSNRDEEEEHYDVTKLMDIKEQFFFHCLAKKGLADATRQAASSDSAELHLPECLRQMLEPLSSVKQRSKLALDELKTLFPLKPVVKKIRTMNEPNEVEPAVKSEPLTDVDMAQVTDIFQSTLSAVGSVTPVQDFLTLLKKPHADFDTLCEQMQTVIMDLLVRACDADMLEKPCSALKCLRQACLEQKKTADFNSWLHKVKETAVESQLTDFWSVLKKDNLGLITREEMPYSFYSKEEGEEFLDFNVKVRKTDGSDEEPDYDAMLMEM